MLRTYIFWQGPRLKFGESPDTNNLICFYKAETIGQALEMFRRDTPDLIPRIACIREIEPRLGNEVLREIK